MIDSIEIRESLNNKYVYNFAIIGSSQAKYAFDLSDHNGINFASRPQTLSIDRELLINNVSKIKEDGVVIISLCIMEFFLLKFKNSSDYLRYASIIPHHKFDRIGSSWNYSTHLRSKMPLIYNPLNLRYVIRDVERKNTLSIDYNLCNSESILEKDAQSWISLWNKEFSIRIPNTEIPDNLQDNIKSNIVNLKLIIDCCKRNGILPVVIIPPVTGVLFRKFSCTFLNKYLYDNINSSVTGEVPILNYLTDPEFSKDELYMNSFFLNKKGRSKFTKKVLNDIINIRI